ncbi:hypothetical protein, partial [Brevibacillus laterosporus]|nr:hypothetical protein [Brevibacillus laterosporus]
RKKVTFFKVSILRVTVQINPGRVFLFKQFLNQREDIKRFSLATLLVPQPSPAAGHFHPPG